MFPTSNPPTIDSINAHYDHYRSLPADENAAHRETILFTTADLAGARPPGGSSSRWAATRRFRSPTSSSATRCNADWAQAYAQAGAIVYMGNTGYGLGDTAAVLYSEKLNLLFADRLDGSMTVGQALAFAKQEYAATPTQSGYHLKVIDEATMMGLPMYRVGTGATAPPPTPAITTTDSATGLPSAPFSVTPSFTLTTTAIGNYYTSDDSFAENRRPIEPTTKLDVTQPGLVAHGALLTALTSTDDPASTQRSAGSSRTPRPSRPSSSATSATRRSCSRSRRSRLRPARGSGSSSSAGSSGATARPRRRASARSGGSPRSPATSSTRLPTSRTSRRRASARSR